MTVHRHTFNPLRSTGQYIVHTSICVEDYVDRLSSTIHAKTTTRRCIQSCLFGDMLTLSFVYVLCDPVFSFYDLWLAIDNNVRKK